MISVEDARERILGFFSQLDTEERAISDALGQVLTEDIVGKFDVPPWDNSAMDGYALKAPDIAEAHPDAPVTLDVIGSIAAGDVPSQSVRQGAAIRIMTGAPVPDGADAVVPFEDTDEGERGMGGQTPDEISVRIPVPSGGNVRPAGGDIAAGTTVIEASTLLRASEIGVLASLGFGTVKVIRRPVAAILATGNELIEPDEPYQPGKIYNSNSYGVEAAVHAAGGIPKRLGVARDTVESISAAIREGMAEADVVISTAGVSKGDYDLVKDVLPQHGRIELWSVRMRPAKPLAFGMLSGDCKQVPLLGLPGNPVSSLVAFEQLGRPALFKMMGRGDFERPTVQAVLEEPLHNPDSRRVYARAIVSKRNGTYYARLTGEQGSNVLTSMSRANGLAICPEDDPVKETGEVVTVQMTDWPESVF
jgi:molybdopterin molybdotransferase